MGRVGVSEGMLGRVGEAFWDGLLLLLGVCGAIVVCVCGFVECGVVWRVGKWRVHKVRDLCLYLTCYGVLSELKGQAYGETEIMECLTSKTKDGCSFCE